jgi:hypothetical protein
VVVQGRGTRRVDDGHLRGLRQFGGIAERKQRARDDGSLDRTGECRCSERRGV